MYVGGPLTLLPPFLSTSCPACLVACNFPPSPSAETADCFNSPPLRAHGGFQWPAAMPFLALSRHHLASLGVASVVLPFDDAHLGLVCVSFCYRF